MKNFQFSVSSFQNKNKKHQKPKGYQLTASSKSVRTAFIIVLFFIFSISGTPFGNVQTAKADELSDLNNQLNELNQQINQINSDLAAKRQEKKTLQNEIAIFDGQIYQIQLQINRTDAEISKLQKEIEDTLAKIKEAEDNLAKQKEILNENLRILYEEGQTSSMELVAGSDNLSEYMNKTEYLKSIQDKVTETIDKIKTLKTALDQKKKELETKKTEQQTLKNQQVAQKQELASQKSVKSVLMSQVVNQETELRAILKEAHKTEAAVYAERQRKMAEQNVRYGGGTSAYPWNHSTLDPPWDPWLFYKLQCTSYVAWKWNNVYGKTFYNKYPGQGDARNWAALGRDLGYSVSSAPRPGSILVSTEGYYGHVAIVESLNDNGTINISEYNYMTPEGYGERYGLSPAGYSFIY